MSRLRTVGSLGLLTLLLVLGFSASAHATTGAGTQNPDLAATASISPDTATNGDVVTITETVQNTSPAKQSVTLVSTLTTPNGSALVRRGKVVLQPGASSTSTRTYTVDPADARGVYTLRLDATSRTGTSSATATVRYV